jgi:hypothetical protein
MSYWRGPRAAEPSTPTNFRPKSRTDRVNVKSTLSGTTRAGASIQLSSTNWDELLTVTDSPPRGMP